MTGQASESELPYELANPPASSTIEALRGIGYDVSTAIADLIDNSISAGARNVRIDFAWAGADSTVSILDDGCGMSTQTLAQAMILGCRSPLDPREETDLGRFGLGLKTASFSQARRLIVASRDDSGSIASRQWDLDYVIAKNEWRVLKTPTRESECDISRLERLKTGTLVRWEALDVLIGHAVGDGTDASERFSRTVDTVRAHLGMVFHRYLSESPRIRISINGEDKKHAVEAWDPFCLNEKFTESLPEEPMLLANFDMRAIGHILPHRDNFSSDSEFVQAAGPSGWSQHQGFFVYRNRRLLLAGGWMGLGRPRPWTREEHYKLARIQLDIPNSLDAEWRIDVRKAQAKPPAPLRERLTQLAEIVRLRARRVFAFRGQYKPRQTLEQVVPVWTPTENPSGQRVYRVNKEHPLVADLMSRDDIKRTELRQLLRLVEATVPVQQVWLDVAEKPEAQASSKTGLNLDEVLALADELYRAMRITQRMAAEVARDAVLRYEPFNSYPEVAAHLDALEQQRS